MVGARSLQTAVIGLPVPDWGEESDRGDEEEESGGRGDGNGVGVISGT